MRVDLGGQAVVRQDAGPGAQDHGQPRGLDPAQQHGQEFQIRLVGVVDVLHDQGAPLVRRQHVPYELHDAVRDPKGAQPGVEAGPFGRNGHLRQCATGVRHYDAQLRRYSQ